MAYFSKEDKENVAPAVKAVLKKYGIKGRLTGGNSFGAVVKIQSGAIDFIANYNAVCGQRDYDGRSVVAKDSLTVNPYWYDSHFDGVAVEFLDELIKAMKGADWYNNTDISIDYFDTRYYVNVNIGTYDNAYKVTA